MLRVAALFCIALLSLPQTVAAQAPQSLPGLGAARMPVNQYESLPSWERKDKNFVIPKARMLERLPQARHQGAPGTCVGWALAYTKTILDNRKNPAADLNADDVFISPIFIYQNVNTDPECKAGVYVETAADKMRSAGAATLAEMPYEDGAGIICRSIPAAAKARGLTRRTEDIGKVSKSAPAGDTGISLQDLDDLKYMITKGYPVVIVVRVTDTLYTKWYNKSVEDVLVDLGPDLKQGEQHQYHAMTAVGFDDTLKGGGALRVLNSWGPQFGDNGLFWLSYTAAQQILVESYSIREE